MVRKDIPTVEEVQKRYLQNNIPHVMFMATVKNENDTWEEPIALDVTTLNVSRPEVIDHYRKKGWPVIGYGCLTNKPEHRELAIHLETLTELGQQRKLADLRAKIEAEVRAEAGEEKRERKGRKRDAEGDANHAGEMGLR